MKANLLGQEHIHNQIDGITDQRRLQALFNNAQDAILMVDERMQFIEANPAACLLTGYSRDELLKLRILDITPPPNSELLQLMWKDLLSLGKLDGEYELLCKDGNLITVKFRAVANILPGLHMGIVHSDTTNPIANTALYDAQARMGSIISGVTDVHIVFNNEWKYIYVNEAAVRSIGRSRANILGCTLWELYPDIVGTELEVQFQRAMSERLHVSFDFYYPTNNTWWENRFYPVSEGLAVFGTDITKRKRVEQQNQKLLRNLGERVKELTALHGWARVLQQEEGDTQNVLHKLVSLLPPAFQYPEITVACIRLGEKEARTPGFADSVSVLEAEFTTADGQTGSIQVGYTQACPAEARGPFLVEESNLLNTLTEMLRSYLDRKRAEEETKRHAARAETLARIAARLNKQLDLDAVIHAVCEEAVNTFNVSQATISLYDKKSDLLSHAGGINIPPAYSATIESITGARFNDFLEAMGPLMVVPDIQSLRDVPNVAFNSDMDVRTVVVATMLRDQELVGTLTIGVNGHIREFDQDELTLLKAISDQAAQAIANALLLRAANEQHEQLRALSNKLVEAQEAERWALTTELHDRVGQNLTGLSINLQNMKELLSDETAKVLTTKFDDVQALVEDTTSQVRHVMAELHPPELKDYGLAVALESYAERTASRGNLELIAELPDLAPPALPSDIGIALFRAVQEAINNVLKHAGATQLEISLVEQGGKIQIRVEDNGIGFRPDLPSQKGAQTWGLKIMRERIESIGGKVEVKSEPGQGTRVTFEIERS